MEQITEKKAVIGFVNNIFSISKNNCHKIIKLLNQEYGMGFVIIGEEEARHELTIALLAQELLALKALYSRAQGMRIYNKVLDLLGGDSPENYVTNEVKKYIKDFDDAVKANDPQEAVLVIPERLLKKWTGKNTMADNRGADIQTSNLLSPLTGPKFSAYTVSLLVVYWQKIKENYQITSEKEESI